MALEKFNNLKRAIIEAKSVDEISEIIDMAEAYRYALKMAKESPLVINAATEIKLIAERRAGQKLKDMDKQKPGEYKRSDSTTVSPSLSDIGITKDQSSRWQKVADVPEEIFNKYLAKVKDVNSDVQEFISTNGLLKMATRNEIKTNPQRIYDMPKGKYNIIYADPPWRYYEGGNKNQSQHYNTMSLEEICNLPVNELSAEDCVLFMWVTFPMLEHFIDVFRCWGFEYSTVAFVWIKSKKDGTGFHFGNGNWTRANAELCVLGRCGRIQRIDKTISQIIYEPRQEHSKKPNIVREKIVQLLGNLPKIELFAREKIEDWDVWGNEV